MANIAETVTGVIRDTVTAQGVDLWDVRFVKEGADYFLRVYIDKAEGVGIEDCVRVSHAIDPLLDETDPIDHAYCLEVCSPGLNRELSKPEHLAAYAGKPVTVKLYTATDGSKEWTGTLGDSVDGITLECDGTTRHFTKEQVASVKAADD